MIRRLFILLIGLAILIGIPYFFGWGWLFGSWLPAIFAMLYLDN
jgi:hypothetical protein